MRISVFILLMILSCKSHQYDSATTNQVADSLIAKIRNQLASNYNDKEIAAARRYLDSIRSLVTEINHPALSSAWFAYRGRTFIHHQPDSAQLYLDTAIKLADVSGQPKAKVIATIHLVSHLLEQRSLDSALKHSLAAIELSKIDPPLELPLLYLQLSYLYKAADDELNYRKYLFDGLKISKDPMHIAAFSSDIGRYYIENNRIDSAFYFLQHFQEFNQFSAGYIDARKYDDLGNLLLSRGKTKEGLECLKQALLLYSKEGYKASGDYIKVGVEYNKIGNLHEANRYFDTALALARGANDKENISNSLFHKSTILLKNGRSREAYQFLDSSYIYHLQHDTTAFRNQAKDLEARVKDEKIASLAAAVNATEQISSQRLFIIITLTMLGGLMIVLGVLLIRRRKMQMLLKEAQFEQQLLRSQMEPHFIFNSLGTLQSYIRNGATAKSVEFLDRFSRLLRLSLENSRKNAVPLKDEVAALETYLNLQSSQRNNSFDYFIETYLGFEKDDITIPPMLIQPFVENAILHGFTNPKERGWVTIKITRHQQTLCCVIEDNGVGLNGSEQPGSKRSLSTVITKERLQLLSKQTGRKAAIDIVDKKKTECGKGVRVTLKIPIKPHSQQ